MIDGDDDASVLDEDSAADGSDLDGAPSIIRRLSGGATSSDADSGDAVGSIFDDFGAGGVSDSDVRLVMDDRLDTSHDSGQDVLRCFHSRCVALALAPRAFAVRAHRA